MEEEQFKKQLEYLESKIDEKTRENKDAIELTRMCIFIIVILAIITFGFAMIYTVSEFSDLKAKYFISTIANR